MKSRHIAQHDRCNADQMQAEQKPTEAKLIRVGFQSSVAESQEDREGGNRCGGEWSQQRSDMRNAGEGDTVQRQHEGKQIKPLEKMAGQRKKPP